jgi:hypothetical protein
VKQVSEPDEITAELVRLREENARLRALLGMDERPADGHSVAWSPTLLSNLVTGPAVNAQSSNAAKLELFRARFGAPVAFHTAEFSVLAKDGLFMVRVGHGTDLAPLT